MQKDTILVVDDDPLARRTFQRKLEDRGYHVIFAGDGEAALSRVQADSPSLVTLDIKMPGMSGVDVLLELRRRGVQIPVIMVTAFGVVDDAVRSLKLGAYDFIEKPVNFEKLENVILNALEAKRLRSEVARTHAEQRSAFSADRIIGVSEHVREVRALIRKVAVSCASTILIQGESGTGKDLVAHAMHYESARRDRPFFAVNCAAIPETLMESELFGHEKGAFTDAGSQKKGLFEMADGGTLFLDEISEMTLGMQAKLLRVMEGQTFRRVGGVRDLSVDVRIVVASNLNLEDAARAGKFRKDLFFRLSIIPVHLLPLREHKEDIPPLLEHFIRHYNMKFRKNIQGLTKEAEELLMNYNWPGNIRELKNAVERVMILAEERRVPARYLPIRISERGAPRAAASAGGEEGEEVAPSGAFQLPSGGASLADIERDLLRQALVAAHGNKTTAARLLGITRDTLRYKVKKYKLEHH
ncbi:MAG: sigma-54 dependent transcriptional regulator [Acidobacteriota bacterium]|jgi:DNA-binding NtrC family response regulator|nr:sigma-54 dependent transcriptional regulator [Acidobacteriota bacterium]